MYPLAPCLFLPLVGLFSHLVLAQDAQPTTLTTIPGGWVAYTDASGSVWTAGAPTSEGTTTNLQAFDSFMDALVVVAARDAGSGSLTVGGQGMTPSTTVAPGATFALTDASGLQATATAPAAITGDDPSAMTVSGWYAFGESSTWEEATYIVATDGGVGSETQGGGVAAPAQTGVSSGSGSTTAVTITSPSYPGYCLAVFTLLQDDEGAAFNKLNDSTPIKLLHCNTENRGQYWSIDSALLTGMANVTTNVGLFPFDSGVNYCMDASQQDPDNSTPVQVWDCACGTEEWSGTSGQSCNDPIVAQQWTFESVQYLGSPAFNLVVNMGGTAVNEDRPFGVCLDVTNSNTDSALQSWSCNDPTWPNGNQVFTFSTDTPYTGTSGA